MPTVSLHAGSEAPLVRYHGTTAKQHVQVPPAQQTQQLHAYPRKPLAQATPAQHWPSSSSLSTGGGGSGTPLPTLRATVPRPYPGSDSAHTSHHGDEGLIIPSGPAAATAYRVRAEVRAALLNLGGKGGNQRQQPQLQGQGRTGSGRFPPLSGRSRSGSASSSGWTGGGATPAVSFDGDFDGEAYDDDAELTGWPLEALVGQFEHGATALPPGMRPLPAGAAARLRHTVSVSDFSRGLSSLGVRATAEEVGAIVTALRLDDAGRVLYQRFVSFVAMPAPGATTSLLHAHGSRGPKGGGSTPGPHFSGGIRGHFDGPAPPQARRSAWGAPTTPLF